jgi:hypothetical protein
LNPIDAINSLRRWVEEGVAPETIIATKFVNDTPPAVQMTRPLCVFPKVAKWDGIGDPNIAASFACVTDEPDFNQMPAPKYGPWWCENQPFSKTDGEVGKQTTLADFACSGAHSTWVSGEEGFKADKDGFPLLADIQVGLGQWPLWGRKQRFKPRHYRKAPAKAIVAAPERSASLARR